MVKWTEPAMPIYAQVNITAQSIRLIITSMTLTILWDFYTYFNFMIKINFPLNLFWNKPTSAHSILLFPSKTLISNPPTVLSRRNLPDWTFQFFSTSPPRPQPHLMGANVSANITASRFSFFGQYLPQSRAITPAPPPRRDYVWILNLKTALCMYVCLRYVVPTPS